MAVRGCADARRMKGVPAEKEELAVGIFGPVHIRLKMMFDSIEQK